MNPNPLESALRKHPRFFFGSAMFVQVVTLGLVIGSKQWAGIAPTIGWLFSTWIWSQYQRKYGKL